MCLGDEKIVENMFSIAFSGLQPNTRKYFTIEKHFSSNQTLILTP